VPSPLEPRLATFSRARVAEPNAAAEGGRGRAIDDEEVARLEIHRDRWKDPLSVRRLERASRDGLSEISMGTLAELALELCRGSNDDGFGAQKLERLLCEQLDNARQKWPRLDHDDIGFGRYLADRLPHRQPVHEAICAIATDDLYLAFGCYKGDASALAAFEKTFLSAVGTFIVRIDTAPAFVDEVRQALRERLLARTSGEPGISAYSGRGPLGGWVRVAALRTALNLQRGERRAESLEEAAGALGVQAPLNPELAFLSEQSRGAFAQALQEAIAQLSDRDRTLLRLYHSEGLALEALGALYRVHLSTVSRWLACAREQVAEKTIRGLREALRIGPTDAQSLAAQLLSQLDVSIWRLLAGTL